MAPDSSGPPDQYPALRAFLDNPSRPPDVPRYHEVQGFLFAMAGAPEMVSPSEWLPLLLDGLPEDRRTTEVVIDETMALYNDVVEGVVDGTPALPADCQFRDEVLANLERDAPVSQWSRGFIHGHSWLEESWEALAPEELDEALGSATLVLSFFASPGMANALMGEIGATDLTEMAGQMREMFPLAMSDYAGIGLEIDAAAHTPVRVEKIGRNDPCPCGSGKKHKKCCGS